MNGSVSGVTHLLHATGMKLTNGPLIHGLEDSGALGGSGSQPFCFTNPDSNRLEIYADMMRVPDGEEFPRREYADVMQTRFKGEEL